MDNALNHDLELKYKRTQSVFDKVAESSRFAQSDYRVMERILSDCDVSGKRILEVGCGIGDNLIYCARKGALYTEGFDISSESIKLAQLKARDLSNIYFHTSSIERYESKKKFDIVLAIGVFEYFERPFTALEKIRSLLADNGIVIIFISKPIFLKKISFLGRMFLSKIPTRMILPLARFLSSCLGLIKPVLGKRLYPLNNKTYTFQRAVLEGLMVDRYNICDKTKICDYLKKASFSIDILDDIALSMCCIVAKRKNKMFLKAA